MNTGLSTNTAARPLAAPTLPGPAVARRMSPPVSTTDTSRSLSDSFVPRRASADVTFEPERIAASGTSAGVEGARAGAPTSDELLEQPRYSMLVDLMERLTGREIKLVPPTTIVLGQRKQPTGGNEVQHAATSSATQISSVTTVSDSAAFRLKTVADLSDGGTARAQFDVGMDVVQEHRNGGGVGTGPLTVQVSAAAASSSSSEPLIVQTAGSGVVKVSVADES